MNLKLDIENKILIPFIIILLLTIGSLGIVSYWNGYQTVSEHQKKNIEDYLNAAVFLIDEMNDLVESGAMSESKAKEKVLKLIISQNKANMIVIEDNSTIVDTSYNENLYRESISSRLSNDERVINNKDWIFIYKNYEDWDWIIGFVMKKNIFSEELLAIQKNTLLIAIIALVFSMQSTIFIAHNISKPIKLLADMCNKIAKGNLREKISINRKDEIGILASAFDNMIGQLRMKAKKLIEIKKFNEDILRNVPAGIITTDRDGNVISVNKAGQEILGFNPLEENKSFELSNIIFKQLKTTLGTEENINNVYSLSNENDNAKKYLDVTTSLLITEKNLVIGAICNFNDITKRKKIENKMDRVNRLASLGQLAAGLAHEIRNPLAGMRMSIQVLKKRLCKEEETESNVNLFNATLYEIDRLNNLITDLLDFARPHVPKYEVTDIIDILNRSLYLIQKSANEKRIEINLSGNEKPQYVFVDKAQIEQVFLNVLTNSMNAMEVKGVLNINISNVQSDKGSSIMIEFEDNGCGIKEEDLEKIFNPFYTTNPQGTGLGLSVVHKLVTENNGEIDIESIVNIGTKFRIKIPLYSGDIDEEKSIDN